MMHKRSMTREVYIDETFLKEKERFRETSKSLKQNLMNWRDSGKMAEQEAQECVSPPRQQLHWKNLSGVTILELWNLSHVAILELWSLLKSPTFKRRLAWYIMVNFSQFQFLAQQPLPTPTCSPVEGSCASPQNNSHTACGNQCGQYGPCPSNIWDLCSDY